MSALHIKDFVLIDSLSMTLDRGLTVLTGETGAGKSILLEALGLAVGGRAARGGVREGARQGIVAAVFEPSSEHGVWALLDDNGIGRDDDQIILKRVQSLDGRSRAFVNDQPVSVALLRDIGGALLEIHGQHDGRGFLTATTHRALLDEFGGLAAEAAAVSVAWRDWRAAAAALDARRATIDKAAQETDYLRHVVDELEALAPEVDEEAALATRRAHLMAAEKIAEDLSAAERLLSENALEGDLSACARRLGKAASAFPSGDNPLSDALARLEAALSEVMEARAAVEDAAAAIEFDAGALEAAEERLFALRASARKHGVEPARLPEALAAAKTTLADLEAGEASFADLQEQVDKAARAYDKAAKALSAGRLAAGARLDAAVAGELHPLKLGHAQFETAILVDPDTPGPDGFDRVEFMVATNPGAPLGPLKTIASGGELSRFVLAMKAALAAKENRTVIIFDEVDAGVGGAVADAVGERLYGLARNAQVLVVTHSPQVAARGSAHWRISKTIKARATRTDIAYLDGSDRVEEIARMLAGAAITPEARAAAESLLSPPRKKQRTKAGAAPAAKKPAARRARKTA
ncbi:MAG: DNA repair protein RecN [Pseudomonadota bacterium]